MAKLTEAQLAALQAISSCPCKSGKFYADLGHQAVSLSSLHWRKLIQTDSGPIIGRSIYGALWSITDAGRAALAAHSASAQGGKGE